MFRATLNTTEVKPCSLNIEKQIWCIFTQNLSKVDKYPPRKIVQEYFYYNKAYMMWRIDIIIY